MSAFFAWIAENRAMLVPPVFGFLALYLLLPREYRFWRPIGIAFGVVALGVLGYLFSVPGMSLNGLLFYLFAGMAIVAAAATVTFPNPIYSALSFALVVLSVSGLFVLRGAVSGGDYGDYLCRGDRGDVSVHHHAVATSRERAL